MSLASSNFASSSGDGYELQMGRWSRKLSGPFLDFAGVNTSGRILDAGCGTGALAVELLQRTEMAEIVGIDISDAYVAHAKSAIGDQRATFETGDLTALHFADGTFDQVFSQLVLQFVPNSVGAIGELVRVTRPGGSVAAAVWDLRGGLIFNRLFLDTAAMLDPAADALRSLNFTRYLTRPDELAEAWRAAGLVDRKAGEVTIRTDFSSFEDYWKPFDGKDGPIPAYLRKAAPEMRQRVKDAVRRAYLDGEEDGRRSYAATTWVVVGRKQSD
ncbi:MAG: methyltransferase domain-containing protein [Rhodospirillaceae bacterium]|nr:methyltransferase domain-containing protein [Rhodospirillaceae bacterium]MBT5666029.1 methyltransferase domain-containing protein [Rhodospirillaceae bacterium]